MRVTLGRWVVSVLGRWQHPLRMSLLPRSRRTSALSNNGKVGADELTASYFEEIPDALPSLISFLDFGSRQTVCHLIPLENGTSDSGKRRLCLRNHFVDAPCGLFARRLLHAPVTKVVFKPTDIWIPRSAKEEYFHEIAKIYGSGICHDHDFVRVPYCAQPVHPRVGRWTILSPLSSHLFSNST